MIQPGSITDAEQIEAELLKWLRSNLPQGKNEQLVFVERDESGKHIAGVTGSTSYGWLLVKCLWVADSHQAQGRGQQLMTTIEQAAKTDGCHHAWLDTSNPAAKEFYLKQGYEDFGHLENGEYAKPKHHKRWFLKKAL